MKYYTVKEVAKKLNVSANHVYEIVKRGELKKADGIGRIIRIPSTELKKVKDNNCMDYFDEGQIEVITTYLGSIRKLKEKDSYLVVDIARAIGLYDSSSICTRADECELMKIPQSEAVKYGLRTSKKGISFITLKGIKSYAPKSTKPIDFNKFLRELKVEEYKQQEFKEKIETDFTYYEEPKNGIQVLEQKEVLGQAFKIYGTSENPLFLARDVASWIEHSKTSMMLESVDDDEKLKEAILTSGQKREMWFLTEDGLYEVLMQSRKPIAKQFKKQIKVILKDIRLTGGYVANETKFVNNYFSSFSPEVKQAMINDLQNKNNELFVQKEEVDKALTENIRAIKQIRETL